MNILHSKIYGETLDNTPIVIVHGLFGMSDNWGFFGKTFGKTHPTHTLDLRNHGKSFHNEKTDYPTLAKDMLGYLDFHKIEKAHFIGHSMGGKVVMQFAMDFPERIDKLIVVDMAPKKNNPRQMEVFEALNAINLELLSSRSAIESELKKHIHNEAVCQFLLKNLYWKEENKLAWRFNLKALTDRYATDIVADISPGSFLGNTLFIAGGKSDYITSEDYDLIKSRFPNSKITTIENVGHWVQSENPKKFLEITTDFLGLG